MSDNTASTNGRQRPSGSFFTVERGAWQRLRDGDAATLKVYLQLSDQADDHRTCYPAIDTIARALSMSDRTVYRAINQLVDMGLIERQSGRATRTHNSYRVLPIPPQVNGDTHVTLTSRGMTPMSPRPDTHVRSDLTPMSDKEEPFNENQELEPFILVGSTSGDNSKRGGRKAKPDPNPPQFDEWWKAFPKRVKKAKAKEAYVVAIAKLTEAGTPDPHKTILDAAIAYATSRQGEDSKWTVHPTTWLNAEQWEDDLSTITANNSRNKGAVHDPKTDQDEGFK